MLFVERQLKKRRHSVILYDVRGVDIMDSKNRRLEHLAESLEKQAKMFRTPGVDSVLMSEAADVVRKYIKLINNSEPDS
jgi:hypothetical protein